MPEPDLFTLPHKALRAWFGRTATLAGALDVDDPAAVDQLRTEVLTLLEGLEAHGSHEDEFVLPLLARHLPDLEARLTAEHGELTFTVDRLRRQLDALRDDTTAGHQLALYRHLRRAEAANLRHLDFEETHVMPALRVVVPSGGLAEVLVAFKAAHPDAFDLYRRAPEALTTAERILVSIDS